MILIRFFNDQLIVNALKYSQSTLNFSVRFSLRCLIFIFTGKIVVMKYPVFIVLLVALWLPAFSQKKSPAQRADSLLKLMTLEEKVGQLHQLSSDFATGPIKPEGDKQGQIRRGELGSMLNVMGAARTRQLQQIALQSKRKIPLLFGQDIIHGFRTTFPIPLGEAASWDLNLIEKSARIAATEASAQGLHWTFAPMVDIARDPRWGRIMEGAGEDPYLGSLVAAARVRGFQGKGIGNTDAMMACAKHFAAYGAGVGGRDYNSVDMSLRQLYETYLPPFKAAVDAGIGSFMNSFNDINGIPATGSRLLQREILKGKWGFKGFVVSDWGSIDEMIDHGYAKDTMDAAWLAINAGNDMDMESNAYHQYLVELVKEGKVSIKTVDEAVKRILTKKFELGLFDNPYRFCDETREKMYWDFADHRKFAREIATKSIVMLKNEKHNNTPILPLNKNQKIALVGPLVKSQRDNLGFWSFTWDDDSVRLISLWQGMNNISSNLLYAKGCNINDNDTTGFAEAIAVARKADVIVMQVGEHGDMSGEAKSRHNIHLPGVQEQLIKSMVETGKPVVVLISAGRPLVFEYTANNATAILYTWWLGIEAGNAMADILFGLANPSGKLPVTFPRNEGQIPIYYNHFNTGRPAKDENDMNYVSAYIDLPNSPKYPFGYGIGYSPFTYSNFQLSKTNLKGNEKLIVSVEITNSGKTDGDEVVQLYIRDWAASVVRPVKELKAFEKVHIKAGETKKINFTITTNMLRFYNDKLIYDWEPGEFEIMAGGNSRDVMSKKIYWTK